ncbi:MULTISPECIES: hypothetical protein [Pseudomonas]|uniref:hypothetical protein n=1 Tax=Pseudomonas TaxID=286 RepID=UPI000F027EDD|nr:MULTISPECIES: hypothetical protein [Pseudomonas]MBD8681718.1 hypothetical protein [Pseudomonas sp. CFBP 13719]
MDEKEYQTAKTRAAWLKRNIDEKASILVAQAQSLDPNQALMLMTLIGHRLLEAQGIRQSKGLAKYANLKSESSLATAKTWKIANGLKPEEVVFGSNVKVVSDLLNAPRSNVPAKPGQSLEEAYAKQLIEYADLIEVLNAHERDQELEPTSFTMMPAPTKVGQPRKNRVERVEKEIGDMFSRLKMDFAKRSTTPGNMGRPGKSILNEWWEFNAKRVVEPRKVVLGMDAELTEDADIVLRAHKLNLKIAQVAKSLISNKRDALPDAVVANIEHHRAVSMKANTLIAPLLVKIEGGNSLSPAESKRGRQLMDSASEQRYQFYIDDLKARFPLPFKDPVVERYLKPKSLRAKPKHSVGLEP